MTAIDRSRPPAATAIGVPRDWRFAEFFAGIGLVRMGLERADARWTCVFANDIDPPPGHCDW